MKIFDENNKLTYHNGWWHGSNSVFVHLLKSKVTIIAIGNKYSQRVYSAMALSGLFEPFPFEIEKLNKVKASISFEYSKLIKEGSISASKISTRIGYSNFSHQFSEKLQQERDNLLLSILRKQSERSQVLLELQRQFKKEDFLISLSCSPKPIKIK